MQWCCVQSGDFLAAGVMEEQSPPHQKKEVAPGDDDKRSREPGKEFWDLLHLVLPRFLRISQSMESDELFRLVRQDISVPMEKVQWMRACSFVALPGYVSLSSLGQGVKEEGCIFPMDVASGVPPAVLKDCMAKKVATNKKILDLCCCPGGKYLMLSDFLSSGSIIVGVDVSQSRLYTTKKLLHKYIHAKYQKTQIFESPRMLLFCSDGTHFSGDKCGQLVYDSVVGLQEIQACGFKRKRNKSLKGREDKRLKDSLREILEAEECFNNSIALSQKAPTTFFNKYDAVLVDAQCTHDSSYRHMRYVCEEKDNVDALGCENCAWSNEGQNHKKLSSIRVNKDVSSLQKSLLMRGFNALAPGGDLVYSTCSAEVEQNEDVVRWLIDQRGHEVEIVSLDSEWSSDEQIYEIKDISDNLRSFLLLLREFPSSHGSLLAFLRDLYKDGQGATDLKVLADQVCKHFASLESPPGRQGSLPGTVRFGMWAGTSGLFLAHIRKKDVKL